MKGQNTFTHSQVERIKKLVAEKVLATPYKQKDIRRKIRNIGFHYSDFSSKKDGYTVADFEALLHSGQIGIADGNYIATREPAPCKTTDKPKRAEGGIMPTNLSNDLNKNLDTFKRNRFDPCTDHETTVANCAGNYILCLRKNSSLPAVSLKPILTNFEGNIQKLPKTLKMNFVNFLGCP